MRAAQPERYIRVLVADSSTIHCELLMEAIAKNPSFKVVGFATTSADLRGLATEGSPHVLLISPSLDDKPLGGLEVLADLRLSHPELKSVVMLESPKREIVVQAFRLGARGVFSRNSPVKVLGKCISCVEDGQIWANSQELGFVLEALSTAPAVRPVDSVGLSQLSARELEVVNCLMEGLSNQEIAQRLKLSKHTIKNYMFRIFDKVGVSSRVELLFYALSHAGSENRHPSPGDGPRPGNGITLATSPQVSKAEARQAVSRQNIEKSEGSKQPDEPGQKPALLARLASA